MEVESLWTLIRGAKAFFGVDSGPLHLALGSTTPTTFLQHRTGFMRNFYDEGLGHVEVVDTTRQESVPEHLIPLA